jgi:outer membrane receptor protein involved in Fe transport
MAGWASVRAAAIAAAVTVMAVAVIAVGQAQAGQPAPAEAQGVTRYPASFFADQRPNTAADMVARLPGFTLDRGAQVRGFGGAAGNVIIDGQRPTTKQDDLDTVLRRIPAAQVERIDVIRGGAPGIDMQGQTVLANIIRKKNGGTTVVVSSVLDYLPDTGRIMPSVRMELSQRNDGKALEGSFSFFNFWDDGVGSGPHTQYDDPAVCTPICTAHLSAKAGGKDYVLTGAYETPLDGGRLRVNGLFEGTNYLDRESDSGSPGALDDYSRNTQDVYKTELGAHYTKDLSPTLNMELVGLQQAQRRVSVSDYTQGAFSHYHEGDTLAESVLRGVLHWRPLTPLTIDGSVEGAYNIQTTQTYYDVDGAPQQLAAADVRIIERRTEGAVSATWTPDPHYTLEAGMKLEASNLTSTGDTVLDKTLVYPKPRLVFTWSPDARDQLRLRFAREVGQLDFNAFISSAALNTTGTIHLGNPNLVPQDVWVSEAALERKFWASGDLTVTLRHSDISQAVDRILDPTGLFDEPGNIGHATEDELIVDATAPLDKLWIKNGILKAQATWRDSRVTDPTTGAPRPLTQVHPLDWKLEFSQDLPRLRSTWGAVLNGGFREIYYRYDEIDTYKIGNTLQLNYEYKPTAKLAIRLELNNITSRPFKQTYNVYESLRPSPLVYSDWRNERSSAEVHLRLRKTFN